MKNWNQQQAITIIETAAADALAVTEALRQLVDQFGYIDETIIAPMAKAFCRSKAEIYGVIQYYSDFRDQKPGKHILRICQAESCQSVGARELTQQICQTTQTPLGETSADGMYQIEAVYCLGLCANGPAAEIDGQPLAEVSPEKLAAHLKGIVT